MALGLPLGLASAQQIVQERTGASATGANVADTASFIDIVVAADIASATCVGNAPACVLAQSMGGSSVSGAAGGGGAISININPGVTVGQNDATTTVGPDYRAGVAAMSSGAVATNYPGFPGSGGAISITNSGVIFANTGPFQENTQLASVTPARWPIQNQNNETPAQTGQLSESLFFGGGILALSNGGFGPYLGATGAGVGSSLQGGAGGAVSVTNQGLIFTGPHQATLDTTNAGILAISVGGDAAAIYDEFSNYISHLNGWIALGQGAAGGSVTVANAYAISTTADAAPGISALSQGGSGSVATGSIAGGAGGTVIVSSAPTAPQFSPTSSITTSGQGSPGVLANSAGGNVIGIEQQGTSGPGGNVSFSDAAGNFISTTGDYSAGVIAASIAGGLAPTAQSHTFTTDGGTAGAVNVTINGHITTTGNASDGVIAQSIGAGGGVMTVSQPADTSFNFGSQGSPASTAQGVTVTNNGSISVGTVTAVPGNAPPVTLADAINGIPAPAGPQDSIGIVAQSIAGGGGVAYVLDSDVQATLGANGPNPSGAGHAAGTVGVNNNGNILTFQTGGHGILAQSIGGGGGNGKGKGFFIRHGTQGGPGGDGNEVAIGNAGSISTWGWQADGVLAQSIGGGGGAGGNASGWLAAVGGSGGGGGDGGRVSLTQSGTVAVMGDDSIGLVGQSIGGGGGRGGKASSWNIGLTATVGGIGGNGGAVIIDHLGGAILTGDAGAATGSHAYGILAQSIGGGGGTGGSNKTSAVGLASLSVGVGGSGGLGGSGGPASVTAGSVSTQGADAHAVVAQSIGGGGGVGGESAARALAALGNSEVPSIAIAIDVGGSGGVAGNGGTVNVDLLGNLSTAGPGAIGIVGQSIGGGGGLGGDSTALAATTLSQPNSLTSSIAAAVGGKGGVGGNGGEVSIDALQLGASIVTTGGYAYGIAAQSIGGGGGNGGVGDAHARVPTYAQGLAVPISVGGSGGAAGDSSQVSVNNLALIATSGSGAHGVFTQSIGGGGGSADGGTLGQYSTGATKNAAKITAVFEIGGSGGAGGASAPGSSYATQVQNAGTIYTDGGGAVGIVAQSIGGGGGSGGSSNPDTDFDVGTVAEIVGMVGKIYGQGSEIYESYETAKVRAEGSTGGISGGGISDRDADLRDLLQEQRSRSGSEQLPNRDPGDGTTTGSHPGPDDALPTRPRSASEPLPQRDRSGDTTAGSDSGSTIGEDAGNRDITDFDDLLPDDGGSHFDAKALDGEFAGNLVENLMDFNFTLTLGGSGGAAGDGGTVVVENSTAAQFGFNGGINGSIGRISTIGDLAHGIEAQSIGGGGGKGGAATSNALKGDHVSFTASLNVNVGGHGGASGNGGSVTVINGANYAPANGDPDYGYTILTHGQQAMGILAQSIGGGGGSGGAGGLFTGGTASVGGGFGGSGGSAGNGGTVTVQNNFAGIGTGGDDAIGLVAQSIGGGGGFGGTATLNKGDGTPEAIPLNLAVGGSSGSSGSGGSVTVTSLNGFVSTLGARAFGILAQSVGGGGGLAGSGDGSKYSGFKIAGGDSTSSGDGGYVGINLGATGGANQSTLGVLTDGDGAHGIVAQSVGGGGGIVGDPSLTPTAYLPVGTTPTQAGSGSGGNIGVTIGAGTEVLTWGNNAHGIVAQSIGGGGGIVDGALGSAGGSGQGGGINIEVLGGVATYGSGSYGIFAQSLGGSGQANANNGAIDISVGGPGAPGLVMGGAGGAGVFVSGGNTNNILSIGAAGEVCDNYCQGTGIAVQTDPASNTSLTIENDGTLVGTLALNNSSAVYNYNQFITAGTSTMLSLYNGGGTTGSVIDIGGPGNIAQATFVAPMVTLAPASEVLIDADFYSATSDTLTVVGGLQLAGGTLAITPSMLAPQTLPGVIQAQNASGNLTAPSTDLIYSYTVANNAFMSVAGTGLSVNFNVTPNADFTPPGVPLNANQTAAASAIQNLWGTWWPQGADALQLAQVFTNLYGQSAASYPNQLTALSSEAAGSSAAGASGTATGFIGTTQSCPGFVGDGILLAEGECVWARVTGSARDRSASSEHGGYRGDTMAIQGGGQKRLADGWFLGGAIGLEQGWLEGRNGRERSDGSTFMAGVALKRQQGPWLLSAALGFGYGWDDSTRQVVLPGWSALASSSPTTDFQIGRLRASYEIPMQGWYLRPILDLDVIRVHQDGYSESGAGALNLKIEDQSKVFFAATPAVEIGGRFDVNERLIARPYLTLGLSLLSDDTWETRARLQGHGGASSPAMTIATPIPDTLARVSLGVDLLRNDGSEKGWEAKLQYDGEFGDDYSSNGGTLRVGYRF